MSTNNQLPELTKPKYSETIRGVPCITLTEHEHLMRTYALQAIAKATQPAEVTDSMIREAFLTNGFTIKDGHSDLKPYVYAAARALLALQAAAQAQEVDERDWWTDADADAARLALELECLLLDTKDTAAVSRWWASANEALDLHRARLAASQVQKGNDT